LWDKAIWSYLNLIIVETYDASILDTWISSLSLGI
jgi:hypothetical protein